LDPFEALSLRLDPFETCLLWFNLSGDVSFAVRSVWRRVFCGSIRLETCLLRFDLFGNVSLRSVWRRVGKKQTMTESQMMIISVCQLK
jgi:hypothetical protein